MAAVVTTMQASLVETRTALPPAWRDRAAALDFALQPIVNIHTGSCFGLECLLRGYGDAGFGSIQEVLDAAWHDRVLLALSRSR